jgi:hypothetical protein
VVRLDIDLAWKRAVAAWECRESKVNRGVNMRRNLLSITIGFVGLAALAVPARAQTGLPMPISATQRDLPRSGLCRVWIEREREQPPVRTCKGIEVTAPEGSFILYRPRGKRVVHLCRMSSGIVGVVESIEVFDIDRLDQVGVILPFQRRDEETTVECIWEGEEPPGR